MQIHELVTTGRRRELTEALQNGADTEVTDERGYSALMAAVSQQNCRADIVDTLLKAGADPTRLSERRKAVEFEPEVVAILQESGQDTSFLDRAEQLDMRETVLGLAAQHATAAVVAQLLEAGADACQCNPSGYSPLLRAVYRSLNEPSSDPERLPVMRVLLDAGADIEATSRYGECPLTVAARHADLKTLDLLLSRGGELAALMWNGLFPAVVHSRMDDLQRLLDSGVSPDVEDFHERTPLMFAVRCGNLPAVQLLMKYAVLPSSTMRGETPLGLALESGSPSLVEWLLHEQHCRTDGPVDAAGSSPLGFAVEHSTAACVRVLVAAGCNVHERDETGFGLMHGAEGQEMIMELCHSGLSPDELPATERPAFLGYDADSPIDVTASDYRAGAPTRGHTNPQQMDVLYWREMVRTRANAWAGANPFRSDALSDGPAWSADRFGQSLTRLPDGRFVEIGGEHEDYYDPDFYIYNDVIVHDMQGGCSILGYPPDTFRPTDFHTATVVGEAIYVIGCLGYPDDRQAGVTPVYRLNLKTFEMEQLATTDGPGWIHRHRAKLDGNRILITGGLIWDGSELVESEQEWALDVLLLNWQRL